MTKTSMTTVLTRNNMLLVLCQNELTQIKNISNNESKIIFLQSKSRHDTKSKTFHLEQFIKRKLFKKKE